MTALRQVHRQRRRGSRLRRRRQLPPCRRPPRRPARHSQRRYRMPALRQDRRQHRWGRRLIAIALKKVMRSQDTQYWVESINTIGAVYNMLFVSIVMSAFQPWICYGHPNQNGSSMLDNPDVLCIDSSEHTSMVIMALIAILVFILPFGALAFWANLCNRVSVKRGRSDTRIRTFRLLFFRHHPRYYLFSGVNVTLLRGLFVCSVPVVAYGSPKVRTLLMGAVLLSFGVFVLRMKPWCGSRAGRFGRPVPGRHWPEQMPAAPAPAPAVPAATPRPSTAPPAPLPHAGLAAGSPPASPGLMPAAPAPARRP